MPFVALENCQIQDTLHQGTCVIQSGLSDFSKIDNKKVCLDGLKVLVSGGTVPGPQVAPVVVTINAALIPGVKIDGKSPLAAGEVSSGSETAQYTVGQSVVTAPVVLTIINAGQNDIQMT
jgi:hypothetical protein